MQMIFGMTMSNLAIYLKFAMRIFVQAFRDNPLVQIAVPDRATIEEYKHAVGERHPVLADVWATMDGLKLSIKNAATDKNNHLFIMGGLTATTSVVYFASHPIAQSPSHSSTCLDVYTTAKSRPLAEFTTN